MSGNIASIGYRYITRLASVPPSRFWLACIGLQNSELRMKCGMRVGVSILGVVCIAAVFVFIDDFIVPMVLDSRIERLHETGFPKASIENGSIYCRMKADDFRLPLPHGYRAMPPIITEGGFDCVDGSVELHLDGSDRVSPVEYAGWLQNSLQVGASATVEMIPDGMFIKFHYFGDR